MKRTLVLAISVIAACVQLSAYDFMVDKLCYNINADGESVTVTFQNEDSPGYSDISGALEIPPSVSHEGVTYAVTTIGDYAFRGCGSLTSLSIPESVTSIGEYAFLHCSGLTGELIIPNSIISIGQSAFFGCVGFTSLAIGNSVASIGSCAFYNFSGLTSVTIPNSVTSIGSSAFYGCYSLTKTEISDISAWCRISFGTADSNPLVFAKHLYLNGSEIKELVIPNSVTEIGNYAFCNCSGLTSVTIPNSVMRIGDLAFEGCSGLTSIVVETGNGIYDSRENCNAIIKSSDNQLILGCKNTMIPNTVTSIGDYAFEVCSGLTSIDIPNSVTSIGYSAFSSCNGLTSVTIPNSVTEIGKRAFWGCYNLTNLLWNAKNCSSNGNMITSGIVSATIGDEVEILPDNFVRESKIIEITIPNSVKSIGSYAFYDCRGLTSVTNHASTPQTIDDYIFYGVDMANCRLCVWHESIDAYKAANIWMYFDIQDLGGVEGVEADAEAKTVEGYYNLQGVRIDNPERGQVNIIRYTDGSAKKVVVK